MVVNDVRRLIMVFHMMKSLLSGAFLSGRSYHTCGEWARLLTSHIYVKLP
jgi:hypothetical protein